MLTAIQEVNIMSKDNILFEVIVGTYEEFVLGYQFLWDEEHNKGELDQTFATHSHRASVRSVACGGRLIVSGGADETINIYDMLTRKQCGMLMEHNGTITSLSFTPDCSHVISTSEDGSVKIFRQGSWQLEKTWPAAHKGTAVTCLAVHPSGKLAMSVGRDHTLRTWNLVKGRPAYTTNLYSRCRQLESVSWSPGGMIFAVPMESSLELSSTEKAGVLNTLKLPTKVTACVFLSDEVLCVGEESGDVTAHCVRTTRQLWRLPGEQRVRGVGFLHSHLVTVSSGGAISVYKMSSDSVKPKLVITTQTGCRITCLTLYDYKSAMKVKTEVSDGHEISGSSKGKAKNEKRNVDDSSKADDMKVCEEDNSNVKKKKESEGIHATLVKKHISSVKKNKRKSKEIHDPIIKAEDNRKVKKKKKELEEMNTPTLKEDSSKVKKLKRESKETIDSTDYEQDNCKLKKKKRKSEETSKNLTQKKQKMSRSPKVMGKPHNKKWIVEDNAT